MQYITPLTRIQNFIKTYPNEPKFRLQQIEKALFLENSNSWDNITFLPKNLRDNIKNNLNWFSFLTLKIFKSKNNDTIKAVLQTIDNLKFESVLMENKKGQYTICVSSQIGCGMGCVFCATGMMGLKRNLNSDEIIDQYRFWKNYIQENSLNSRISNIVFMGMGEPLANYENVKIAINTILKYTDIGPTKITVSTVGVLQQMQKLLDDATWPQVRIAISLHSPQPNKRKEIVPSTIPNFHERLATWTHEYNQKYGNRRHWITFEYTLINKINDFPEDAIKLAEYTKTTAVKKINVIPYNPILGKTFDKSANDRILKFKQIISSYEIDITQRKTMGDDISASCGQLIYNETKQ